MSVRLGTGARSATNEKSETEEETRRRKMGQYVGVCREEAATRHQLEGSPSLHYNPAALPPAFVVEGTKRSVGRLGRSSRGFLQRDLQRARIVQESNNEWSIDRADLLGDDQLPKTVLGL